MSREAAAMIVASEAISKWKDTPIEEAIEPIMDHCHEHWMGGQCFFTTDEEFGLFLGVLRVVYKDNQEVSLKLAEESEAIKALNALFSGVPVDIERMAEKKPHYQLISKWHEKFPKVKSAV